MNPRLFENNDDLESLLSMKINIQLILKFSDLVEDYYSYFFTYSQFNQKFSLNYPLSSLKYSINRKYLLNLNKTWTNKMFNNYSQYSLNSVLTNVKSPSFRGNFVSILTELNCVRNVPFHFRFIFLSRIISTVLILDEKNEFHLIDCMIKMISDIELLTTILVISSFLNINYNFVSQFSDVDVKNWYVFHQHFIHFIFQDSEIQDLYSKTLNSIRFR